MMLKALDYETANPGQDFDENETKLFDPEKGSTDRPMVTLVNPTNLGSLVSAPESSRRGNSRPISGDTLGGLRRKDSAAGIEPDDITAPGSREGSNFKPRRGSSPLSPLEMHTPIAGTTNRGVYEDYIGVSEKVPGEPYDAGLEVEEG